MYTLRHLQVILRTQHLGNNPSGRLTWLVKTSPLTVNPEQAAIIVCDMWDRHWSWSASERVSAMVPKMDAYLRLARNLGMTIIHAPSDTMDFYSKHPARARVQKVPTTNPTEVQEVPNVPLPIDDSDGGADAPEDASRINTKQWSRQHDGLFIDPSRDAISDNGREIHAYLTHLRIDRVFIMGVHTNMCILNRSFGIRQLLRWGVDVALVRDLTDAMYNPACSPYVSHEAGTDLVIEYIEKFYCPTLLSEHLLQTAARPVIS